MAFATIEDIQGAVDLVIFPKVWDKYSPLVQMETVILVEGKADTESSDPKILVDIIKPLRESDIPADTDPGSSSPEGDSTPGEPWQGEFENNRYIQQEDGYEEPPPTAEEADWHYAPPAWQSNPEPNH